MKTIEQMLQGEPYATEPILKLNGNQRSSYRCSLGTCVELAVVPRPRLLDRPEKPQLEDMVDVIDTKQGSGSVVCSMGKIAARNLIMGFQDADMNVRQFTESFGLHGLDDTGQLVFDDTEREAFALGAYMGQFDLRLGVHDYSETTASDRIPLLNTA